MLPKFLIEDTTESGVTSYRYDSEEAREKGMKENLNQWHREDFSFYAPRSLLYVDLLMDDKNEIHLSFTRPDVSLMGENSEDYGSLLTQAKQEFEVWILEEKIDNPQEAEDSIADFLSEFGNAHNLPFWVNPPENTESQLYEVYRSALEELCRAWVPVV